MAEFAKIFNPRPYHDQAREELEKYEPVCKDEDEGDEGGDDEGEE